RCCTSGPQGSDRNHGDSVRTHVAISSAHSHEHGERRRPSAQRRIYSLSEFAEIRRGLVDLRLAQLYLEGPPSPRCSFDDSVDLESCIVSILTNDGVVGLCVDPQISNREGLEE